MAQTSRKKTSNLFVWILLGLLVIGLMGFGIGNYSGNIRTVGSVGSTEITVNSYVLALRNAIENLARQRTAQLNPDILYAEASQGALDTVTSFATVANEADRIGLSVGDEEVLKRLIINPAFQGVDGKFDQVSYEFNLERTGLSQEEYDEIIRSEETRTLLYRAISAGMLPMEIFTRSSAEYEFESRKIRYAVITDIMAGSDTIFGAESDYYSYYQDNPDRFTAPETREISYVWLTPAMLANPENVTVEEISERYQSNIDRYVKPEQRVLERLVFPSLEEAESAYKLIQSSESSFDDLVIQSGILHEDIFLGPMAKTDLTVEAANKVFDADNLDVVGPVESSVGSALFRINGIINATNLKVSDVETELRKEVAQEIAIEEISNAIESYNDILADGASLEQLASETPFKLDSLSLNDGNSEEIEGFADFRNLAEKVEESDFPEIMLLSNGGIFALRLDSITPPQIKEFEEVREQVASEWRKLEIFNTKIQLAERLLPDLRSGTDFSVAGLNSSKLLDNVRRSEYIEDVPADILEKAFELELGETGIVSNINQVVVFRVEDIEKADLKSPDIESFISNFERDIAFSIGIDTATLYTAYLRTNADIRLDQVAINAVNSQILTNNANLP